MIAEMVSRLFRDHRPEATAARALPPALWQAIAEAGVPFALMPEELGGFGLSPAEAAAILTAAGEQAIPGPLADAMLGNYLLALAGCEPLTEPLALAEAPEGCTGGTAGLALARVGWGREAAALVLVGADWIELHRGPFGIAPGTDLSGAPSDTLTLAAAPAERGALALPPGALKALRAVLTVAQMAGAAEGALALTLRHATDREQFGRPLAAFQAVQHNIAVIASEAAAMRAAADMAAALIPAATTDPEGFEAHAAAAKIRAGEAAGRVAALAHQVHGAIGITREYDLHLFTRPLWAWRDAHGSEAFWSARLGARLCALGPDGLWPELTRTIGARA